MTAKDQGKLLDAGFTIIRKESVHRVSHTFDHRIKFKSKEHREWTTLQSCESKAHMERVCKMLQAKSHVVMD